VVIDHSQFAILVEIEPIYTSDYVLCKLEYTDQKKSKTYQVSTKMKTYSQKLKQTVIITSLAFSSIGMSASIIPANALIFNFSPVAGTSSQAIDGFNTAGALWSSVLADPVTVNVNINFTDLSAGTLGETSATSRLYNYSQVYNALKKDQTSTDDLNAVNSLAKGSTFNLLLNRTANNPNGAGSSTPYLDSNSNANNKTIEMTSANAKALGLQAASNSLDASISFSNLFTWDFNRNDGINSGAFDFVGIAAHEIGHALGFMSGVDILDSNSSDRFYNDNQFTYVTPLDLFRYSTESKNVKAIDWTADKRDKYFSLDGGTTKIASFSTGAIFGDGRQDSHWADNLGLGILDPTGAPGELLQISENDQRAFDAIGWNRSINNAGGNLLATNALNNQNGLATTAANTANVPEPADFVGTLIFAIFSAKLLCDRRSQLAKLKAEGGTEGAS
jgi:hypothetical protein